MKKVMLVLVAMLAISVSGKAQADAEFVGWMKGIAAANGSLRKNVEAKAGAEAAAEATKIADLLGKVKAHFEAKKSHAAMMAGESQAAFAKVAEAAKAGDATEALKTAGATCGGCHNAHREKAADGSYTIKY